MACIIDCVLASIGTSFAVTTTATLWIVRCAPLKPRVQQDTAAGSNWHKLVVCKVYFKVEIISKVNTIKINNGGV